MRLPSDVIPRTERLTGRAGRSDLDEEFEEEVIAVHPEAASGVDQKEAAAAGGGTQEEENHSGNSDDYGSHPVDSVSSSSTSSSNGGSLAADLIPVNLSIAQLDRLCLVRGSQRNLINEHDIQTVLNRVSNAFHGFSRIVSNIGADPLPPAPSPAAGAGGEGAAGEGDFVEEVISVNNNNNSINWDGELSRVQNELQEASGQAADILGISAANLTDDGSSSSSQGGKEVHPLEGIEKFGDVLARATTHFGDLLRNFLYPEVRKARLAVLKARAAEAERRLQSAAGAGAKQLRAPAATPAPDSLSSSSAHAIRPN